MAEKRKPTFIFLLKKPGKKTIKVEVFPAKLWDGPINKYRLRVNGKWFGKNQLYVMKYEIRDLMWRGLKNLF